MAFRPHITMGLALYRRSSKLPTGRLCPLGAGHIQFEVFFHWVTSWIEVEWLVGIPKTDEIAKNVLCQEKSGSRSPFPERKKCGIIFSQRFYPEHRSSKQRLGSSFFAPSISRLRFLLLQPVTYQTFQLPLPAMS
jgi:hypothetical protein